jgi:hypothetical protein
MREGTSGLLFTQNKDGSIRVEVVDYGVEEFGGGDWESWYDLDKANAKRLQGELRKLHSGTFQELLIAEFGAEFDTRSFERFCDERGIEYHHMSWS